MRELDKVAMFPKDNITRDTKMVRDRIITLVPLLSFTITKKTLDWGSNLLCSCDWRKMKQVEPKERRCWYFGGDLKKCSYGVWFWMTGLGMWLIVWTTWRATSSQKGARTLAERMKARIMSSIWWSFHLDLPFCWEIPRQVSWWIVLWEWKIAWKAYWVFSRALSDRNILMHLKN